MIIFLFLCAKNILIESDYLRFFLEENRCEFKGHVLVSLLNQYGQFLRADSIRCLFEGKSDKKVKYVQAFDRILFESPQHHFILKTDSMFLNPNQKYILCDSYTEIMINGGVYKFSGNRVILREDQLELRGQPKAEIKLK